MLNSVPIADATKGETQQYIDVRLSPENAAAGVQVREQTTERVDRILLVFVGAVLLSLVATVLWGLDRGFDLMDEGYYLMMAASPSKFTAPTGFHYVLAKLPNVTGSPVINLRLFQLLTQLTSALMLSAGFWSYVSSTWFKPTRTQTCLSISFAAVASFLFQSLFPASLSYNGLNSFLIFSSAGLLFYGTSLALFRPSFSYWLVASAGLLCGLDLSIRFSACIVCAIVGSIWLALNKNKRHCIYYLLGLACGAGLFVLLFESPSQVQSQMAEVGKWASVTKTHDPSTMIKTYWDDLLLLASTILRNLSFQLLVPVLCAVLTAILAARGRAASIKWLFWMLALGSTVPICFLPGVRDWTQRSYVDVYTALVACASVLVSLAVATHGRSLYLLRNHRANVGALALLFALPFICSFGTCNPILFQSSTCLVPLFLAISAISFRILPPFCADAYRAAWLGGLSTLVAALFIQGYVYHPYLQCGMNLFDQKRTCASLPNLARIKLSQDRVDSLQSINSILRTNGFSDGDPIAILYDMPGLVYALGGSAPGPVWVGSPPPFKQERNAWYHDIARDAKGRLFLMTTWEPSRQTTAALQTAGIDFPSGFDLIGSARLGSYNYYLSDSGTGDRYLNGEINIYKRKEPAAKHDR